MEACWKKLIKNGPPQISANLSNWSVTRACILKKKKKKKKKEAKQNKKTLVVHKWKIKGMGAYLPSLPPFSLEEYDPAGSKAFH